MGIKSQIGMPRDRLLCFLAFLAAAAGEPWPASTPPRGWNSYDSYTWKVSEKDFLASCAEVKRLLGSSGYEYCVVDYLWFQDLDHKSGLSDPITKLHIDQNGRLLPSPDRWPYTVVNGKSVGFKPIADKVHSMGMKFGIHIMRGISTAAVKANSTVLGGDGATAADIGVESELCPWWQGVMAVNLSHPAGQLYYDSIHQQYADWGVDFIKNDCIFGNQFMPDQIKAQSRSIQKTNRTMVYSLSPGGGTAADNVRNAQQISNNVNMYRVTGDDWDTWGAVESHFSVAANFSAAGLIGVQGLNAGRSWPDLDMLPFGLITSPNSGRGPYKNTSLTEAQQRTQMTLWCMARSPLMFGGAATKLDTFTLSLLTNADVLKINTFSFLNKQIERVESSHTVWMAISPETPTEGETVYVALFNLADRVSMISTTLEALGLPATVTECTMNDVWTGAKSYVAQVPAANVERYGVTLLALTSCK